MADHGGGGGGRPRRRPLGATVKPDGSTVIAASQRPDGSWRKEVRVREGYAPREEMAPYRPPSQREAAQQPRHPVGWDSSLLASTKSKRQQQLKKPSNPKLKTKAPPSAASVSLESVTASVGGMRVAERTLEGEALARRVKALRKKLLQIEELEGRVGSDGGGLLLTVEQREKLARKAAVAAELRELLQSK